MRHLKLGLLASAAMSLAFAGTATAQIEDEVIVTSTKRQQTLQETPVTVAVVSADILEKAQILDIQDLQSVVPSLRVGQLQTSANTNFRIRGFGNGANNAGIEPSVGVFIDGVYRSRSAAQIGDLPKLERIEVLSGPQSTLFGKNASAGVISVVTAKPSFTPQGYIQVGAGNYDQRVARGYVTGGVTENMAFSLGGTFNKRDGYAESAIAGLEANNGRDRFNIRGQMLFEPRDDISIRLIADYGEIDEVCCHVTNFANGPTAGAIQFIGGQLANPADTHAFVNFQNADSINEVEDGGLSLHVDVDFDAFTVTSISAYRANTAFNNFDADFTTANLLLNSNDSDIKTFTQELRITSTGDNKVDWMVGGYYFNEDITQITGLDVGDDFRPYLDTLLFFTTGDPAVLAGLEGLYGAAPGSFFSGSSFTTETFTQADEAYSGFATVDFHVNDKLTLTGGLNYTNDKKKVSGFTVNNEPYSNIDLVNDPTLFGVALPAVLFGQEFFNATGLQATPANIAFIESVAPGTSAAINAGVGAAISGDPNDDSSNGLQGLQFLPQFVAFGNSVEDSRSADDKVTWSVRLAYEVNDNINVYATAGTGFKSTSWNLSRDSRPLAADAAALGAAGLLVSNQTFGTRFAGPEEATVFEAGIKARFDRGAFNLAVFDQSIDGFQSNTFIGTGFVLANAGKQSTFGVEFDASYYPIDALKLTFAGIYLDAKYDEFVNAAAPGNSPIATQDLSGQDVAGVPEFGFSTSATYSHDFGSATGFIRGDYQYESSISPVEQIFVGVENPESKTSIVNGSMGITLENGFGIQIWGRNIFGQESFISAFPGVVQNGTINAYPTPPATYGVLLRKDF